MPEAVMLVMSGAALEAVRTHAEETYPHECCGLLLGMAQVRGESEPAREATRAFRAANVNAERAHDRYTLDPQDRLRGEAEARAAGLVVVGFYHSHPDHDAYFSQTDLERSEEFQWGEPWVPSTYSYLVVSVREGKAVDQKAFRVVDGETVDEELVVET